MRERAPVRACVARGERGSVWRGRGTWPWHAGSIVAHVHAGRQAAAHAPQVCACRALSMWHVCVGGGAGVVTRQSRVYQPAWVGGPRPSPSPPCVAAPLRTAACSAFFHFLPVPPVLLCSCASCRRTARTSTAWSGWPLRQPPSTRTSRSRWGLCAAGCGTAGWGFGFGGRHGIPQV